MEQIETMCPWFRFTISGRKFLDKQEGCQQVCLDGQLDVCITTFQDRETPGNSSVVDQDGGMADLLSDPPRDISHNIGAAEIGLVVVDL